MTPTQFSNWLDDPAAIRNVLVEAVANVGGVDTTFYLSVLPYASWASDTPASQPYRAVLVQDDIQTDESVSLDGKATMTVGEIGVDNTDGAFDAWLTYVWTNRPVTILFGDVRWARADYVPVFTGVSADIGNKSRTSVNLKIRDKQERLNAAITEHLLGGTGANQGTIVPLALGEVVNMTPLLIDPTALQYQVHDGTINGLIEIRDNGVPIANDTIGWSAVIVDLAHGTFKLINSPAGTVTVSLQGDSAGGYTNTVAGLVKKIVKNYGAAGNRFTDSEIDLTNFSQFDAAHTQPVGTVVTGTANTVSVIEQLTGALQAQLTTSRAGQLQLLQLDFASLTPTFNILPKHMDEHTLYPVTRDLVQGAVLLSFCPNQTPQSALQTSLPAEALALMGLPYLTTKAEDTTTKTLYRLTVEPTQEDTVLLRRVDATAEAQRRLNIRKVPRTTYQFDGYATLFQLVMGQAVTLTNRRFNLASGPTGIVVSMSTKWAAGRTTVGVMI
jgi:hypothetical protein